MSWQSVKCRVPSCGKRSMFISKGEDIWSGKLTPYRIYRCKAGHSTRSWRTDGKTPPPHTTPN